MAIGDTPAEYGIGIRTLLSGDTFQKIPLTIGERFGHEMTSFPEALLYSNDVRLHGATSGMDDRDS